MGSVSSSNGRREVQSNDIINHPQGDEIIVQDPKGDQTPQGSQTPASVSSLTPRGSPQSGRKTSDAFLSPHSRSPTHSRGSSPCRGDMAGDEGRRKSSASDCMKARILVKTGDQEKSGTDANVYIQLEDNNGLKTINLKLDKPYYDDLERGKLDTYTLHLPEGFERVVKLYLQRDRKGMLDGWFCDYIIVQDPRFARLKKHRKIPKEKLLAPGTAADNDCVTGLKSEYYFPMHRWVNHSLRYELAEYADR
ncbi:uncharacterized protein LOC108676091 [Hyalella azteca]|uniref:Uncharacterized protein LOC108676091 n=1 Tax=Hyalella azteca TaxID=294128 RepID=A0A8B7P0Y3_HYAAZ|nr:uncharacterized protein LOC108676091 [Hyalella azteca]